MDLGRLVLTGLVGVGSLFFILDRGKGHGGGQAPESGSLSDSDLKTVMIKLERSPCFGSCPAYSLVIHGDGQIEYEGKSQVKDTGAHAGRIETDAIRNIVSEFVKAKFEAISEDYSQKCKGRVCTDFPTAIIEFAIKGGNHKVTHYYGCGSAPKVLFELEAAVDKAAGSERWTGDVSRAGPYGTTCFEGK